MSTIPPLVLLILDGWGHRDSKHHNAIALAKTPQWDKWWNETPHCLLDASGLAVGLPEGQMGNSEVGHMHIGAGRVIYQDFTRINEAIKNKDFFKNPAFNEVMDSLYQDNKTLHLMGLFSDGGVHSHEEHLFALIDLADSKKLASVKLHLFLDGRDTPPKSVLKSLERLESLIKDKPQIQIASISGRYYAMDRDKRWERIEPVYDLLTQGLSPHHFESAESAVHHFYEENIFDEFIPPSRIDDFTGIRDQDAIIFFNFRSDRTRQLTSCFVDPHFDAFALKKKQKLKAFISMTQYAKHLDTTIAFPPQSLENTLGEVLSKAHLKQLRLAETEKYAHVTFFFNGGVDAPFSEERRQLIASPKVATYDLKPEMSAELVTDALIAALESREEDVIICNYANADMVGHTGDCSATVEAIECLDKQMSRIWQVLEKQNGALFITADHGNAEIMFNPETGQVHTAHTSEPVPLVFVGKGWHFNRSHGTLADIAPTILHFLGIKIPAEMTGTVLLEATDEA